MVAGGAVETRLDGLSDLAKLRHRLRWLQKLWWFLKGA